MFRLPSGLYFSACLGSLFLSILCTCCSHFFWYCFISSTIFCAPVFSLIHWFFSLSNFVIPNKCLKNFICAASKRFPSLFFSTQASLPNFNAALAVMLWIVNFVSLFICFPKCLRIAPFVLLYCLQFFLHRKLCIIPYEPSRKHQITVRSPDQSTIQSSWSVALQTPRI